MPTIKERGEAAERRERGRRGEFEMSDEERRRLNRIIHSSKYEKEESGIGWGLAAAGIATLAIGAIGYMAASESRRNDKNKK